MRIQTAASSTAARSANAQGRTKSTMLTRKGESEASGMSGCGGVALQLLAAAGWAARLSGGRQPCELLTWLVLREED